MNNRAKKLFIAGGVFVLLVVVVSIVLKTYFDRLGTIQINATPTSAEILINDSPIQNGTHSFTAGTYTIKISKEGFTSYETTLELQPGASETVSAVLEPNSSDTADWYLDHPEDASIADGIASNTYTNDTNNTIRENPIILVLPYTSTPKSFQINYGTKSGITNFYLDVSIFVLPDDPEAAVDANTQLSDAQKATARQPFDNWLTSYRQSSGDTTDYLIEYNFLFY